MPADSSHTSDQSRTLSAALRHSGEFSFIYDSDTSRRSHSKLVNDIAHLSDLARLQATAGGRLRLPIMGHIYRPMTWDALYYMTGRENDSQVIVYNQPQESTPPASRPPITRTK